MVFFLRLAWSVSEKACHSPGPWGDFFEAMPRFAAFRALAALVAASKHCFREVAMSEHPNPSTKIGSNMGGAPVPPIGFEPLCRACGRMQMHSTGYATCKALASALKVDEACLLLRSPHLVPG